MGRELFEETGLTLTRVIKELPGSYTSAPISDDVVKLIICEVEGELQDKSTETEQIQAQWYSKDEVARLFLDDSHYTFRMSGRMQALAYAWACGLT